MIQSFSSILKYVFAFGIGILVVTTAFSQPKEMEFEKGSFADIKVKAKKENKLIFMDCYTSWCGPCKMMASETFANDTIANYFNEHYINCSFDMEKGEGLKLADNYKVGCYPTLLFLDGDGNVVHRGAGYKSVNDLMKFSNDAQSSQNSFSAIEKNYKKNEDDADITLVYINNLSSSCLPYDEILNKYLSKQKEEDLIHENNWKIVKQYSRIYNSKEIQYILKNIEIFRNKYHNDVENFLSGVFFSTALNYCQDSTKTKKDLEEIFLTDKKYNINRLNDTLIFSIKLNFYNQKKDWKSYSELILEDGDRFIVSENTNEICWNIYLYSNDKKLLEKGIDCMNKYMKINKKYFDWALNGDISITPDHQTNLEVINSYGFNVVYAPWDTYASLLYKLKKKNEAKLNAENAIKAGKRFGLDVSETEALLKKIEKL